jgi:hypothetical protein
VVGGGRGVEKLLVNTPTFGKLAHDAVSDQVIRENPASRGTEASAEVLVGPPMK